MPKWLTAIFALFLSIQVFGARGKAVDKFLGSCFSPDTISRVQQQVPHKTTGHCWLRPMRSKEAVMPNKEIFSMPGVLIDNQMPQSFLPAAKQTLTILPEFP